MEKRISIRTLEHGEKLLELASKGEDTTRLANCLRMWRSMDRKGHKCELHMYVRFVQPEGGRPQAYVARKVPTQRETTLCRVKAATAYKYMTDELEAGRAQEYREEIDTVAYSK